MARTGGLDLNRRRRLFGEPSTSAHQESVAPRRPVRLVANVTEKLDHRVGTEIGRHAGADIELRIDLDEIEADDPSVLGYRLERVAQLGIGHAVRLGGHASRYQREVEDVNIEGHGGFVAIGTDPTIGNNLCEVGIQFQDDFIEWSVSFSQQPFPDPCDVAKELTRQTIVNAK